MSGRIAERADSCYAIDMTVTLTIPDSISAALIEKFPDPGRAALEALAAKAYAAGCVSVEGVRRLLGLASRWDAEALLKQHEVMPAVSAEDITHDLDCLDKVLEAESC
jgi:hypothetical protein